MFFRPFLISFFDVIFRHFRQPYILEIFFILLVGKAGSTAGYDFLSCKFGSKYSAGNYIRLSIGLIVGPVRGKLLCESEQKGREKTTRSSILALRWMFLSPPQLPDTLVDPRHSRRLC